MITEYLYIRIDNHQKLFTDKVDLNLATPIFIDSTGQDDEKNKKDLEKLSKKCPNEEFHIDN